MNAHTPRLHAALHYCAGKLLDELECASQACNDDVLMQQLTPTTHALLRWWFSSEQCNTRVDNFHAGQREAILHTVWAHEVLRTDDAEQLYRRACTPQFDATAQRAPPTGAHAASIHCARYQLRMAPGSGLRWVAHALTIWQWANHAAAMAAGRADARFNDRLKLVTANPQIHRRLMDASMGPVSDCGRRDPAQSSPLRHARLLLPPSLRQPFHDWIDPQARQDNTTRALRIVLDDTASARTVPPIALIVGSHPDGMAVTRGGATANAGHSALLRIDLNVDLNLNTKLDIKRHPKTGLNLTPDGNDAAANTAPAAIADFPLSRALRQGAGKLPMLEPTHRLQLTPVRAKSLRHHGRRPHVPRAYLALLRCGLQSLAQRASAFATLDPARSPKMYVLCDTPHLLQPIRRALINDGIARDDIHDASQQAGNPAARVVLDTTRPVPTALTDARICVIVILRTDADTTAVAEIMAAGLSRLWPEPDFATIRSENRERVARRLAPGNLIDMLSIIEHPHRHRHYSDLIRAGLAIRVDTSSDIPPVGDLFVTALQPDTTFDIAFPSIEDGTEDAAADTLADVPTRVLRARQAMPVEKSIYLHAGWSTQDNGLRKAFSECAEHDPDIRSHCLLDRRRHGARQFEARLMRSFTASTTPDAMVRTAGTVYLIDFLPFCPASVNTGGQGNRPPPERTACIDTRVTTPRRDQPWHRVALHAPTFWSWKRGGGTLSTLLSALASPTPLVSAPPMFSPETLSWPISPVAGME